MANRKQIQLKDLEAGAVYTLQIRAVDNLGTTSPWSPKITIETIEDTIAPNAPSGLTWQVSGDDFVATWSEPTLNEDGSVTEDLKDYRVTLYDPAVPGTKKHYYTASERFEFNFAQNKAAFGNPEKRLTIEVRSRDLGGNTSATPTSKTAENGAPGNFTLNAAGERRAIVLNWDGPADYGDVVTANPVQNGLDILEFEVYRGGALIATVSGNTYTYNDSDPGRGEHTYFIRARDVYGGETDSNTDTASASGYWEEDTVAPSPPQNVSFATDLDTNDASGATAYVEVSWDAPTTNTDASAYTDHEGFRVRWSRSATGPYNYATIVDDRADGSVTASFSMRIDDLKSGHDYHIAVQAFDRYQNNSSWASDADGKVTTAADTVAPATPTGLAMNGGLRTISASWSPNTEADFDHYELYASTTSGFTPGAANLKFQGNGTATSWDAGDNETWYSKIRAVDRAGNASAYSAQASATTLDAETEDTTPPADVNFPVGGLTGTTYFHGSTERASITADWDAVADADLAGYIVAYKKTTDTEWNEVNVGRSSTAYTITGLDPNNTFEARIKAVDTSGNLSTAWSTVRQTTVSSSSTSNPSDVTGFVVSQDYYGRLEFSWTEVTDSDLNDYHLQIDDDSAFGTPIDIYVDATEYTWNGNSETTYYGRIKARDQFGNESTNWSATASGTTGQVTDSDIETLTVNKLTSGTINTGDILVGSRLEINTAGIVESENFSATAGAEAGYRLTNNALEFYGGSIILGATGLNINTVTDQLWFGAADFANALFRVDSNGDVRAGGAGKFYVDGATGDIWSGNAAKGSAPWSIDGDGSARFTDVVLTGTDLAAGTDFLNAGGNFVLHKHADGTFEVHLAGDFSVDAGGNININGGNLTLTSGNMNMNGGTFNMSGGQVNLNGAGLTQSAGSYTITGGDITVNGGTIKSNNWNGSSTGVEITSTGITVYDGLISAGALEIHDSPNLVDAGYADFEYAESWYVANMNSDGPTSFTTSSDSRYRAQSLQLDNSADTTASSFYLSKDSATFNIPVEGGKTYIASVYANPDSAVAVTLGHMEDTGPVDDTASGTLTANSWAGSNRISHVFTTGATTTSILLYVNIPAGAVVKIDGVQVEEKTGNSNEPSFFKIGGATTIDGGNITTGTLDASLVKVSTGDTASKVVIDGFGLRLYDGDGTTELVNLDTGASADPRATFRGRVHVDDPDVRQQTDHVPTSTISNLSTGADGRLYDDSKAVGATYASFASGSGAGNGSEGSNYVQFDFGEVVDIGQVSAYWYVGDNRHYWYKIKYSFDGTNWYYARGSAGTAGWAESTRRSSTSGEHPTIDRFWPRISARYLRIYGDGSTANTGNHLYEVEILAQAADDMLTIGQNFRVDSGGNLWANNGTFVGDITGGTISIGTKFSVDSAGNMIASDADIKGTTTLFGDLLFNGDTVSRIITGPTSGTRMEIVGGGGSQRINFYTFVSTNPTFIGDEIPGYLLGDVFYSSGSQTESVKPYLELRSGYATQSSSAATSTISLYSRYIGNAAEGQSSIEMTTDQFTLNGNVDMNAGLDVSNGIRITGQNFSGGAAIHIQETNPEIRFEETGYSGFGKNYWFHHNSGNFYLLGDRTGDGSWNSPYPFIARSSGVFELEWDTRVTDSLGVGSSTPGTSGDLACSGWLYLDSTTVRIRGAGNIYIRHGSTDSWVFGTSSTELLADMLALNDREIRFRGYADSNHLIRFDSGVNGVRVQGYRGVDLWVDNYDTRLTVQSYARVTNKANTAYKQLYADTVDQSDRRWKSNIKPLDSALDTIRNWEVSTYEHYGQSGRRAGLMADTMPENIVAMGELNHPETGEKIETYGYRPTAAIAYLVKAVQELSEEVERLKGEK